MTSLQQEEKDLRALSVSDPPVQETKSGEASDQACPEQSDAEEILDSISNDVHTDLRETLTRSDAGSLQQRQVEHMLREQE